MDQQKTGRFLAQLRREKGITQAQLAEKIGTANKTVSRWETGAYMPDVGMLLILAEFYGVSVNELLSGERLSDGELRQKADDNIGYVISENKKKYRVLLFSAVMAVIAVMLAFISVITVTFISSRNGMLYPDGVSDKQSEKVYRGSLTISTDNSDFDNDIGKNTCSYEFEGKSLELMLPDGFSQKQEGLFVDEKGSFVSFRGYKEVDFAYPLNLALSQYFMQAGITRYVDKVAFAFRYNTKSVGVFSSENVIEITAGVRILRSFSAIANADGDNAGSFYVLDGTMKGFATSAYPEDSKSNVWSVCIEKEDTLLFVTVKTPFCVSSQELCELLSRVSIE